MSDVNVSSCTTDRSVIDAPAVRNGRPVAAVVGGGISGLAAAYHLERLGIECIVLEASDQTGGVIQSRTVDGHLLELGPQRTRLSPPLQALVKSLGLTERLITAPDLPLYIYSRGRLRAVPLDLRTALTTDLISWPDRLRILVEPLAGGLQHDESTADYFVRKFGRRTYHRAIAPLFGDLYGSDPAEMPARHALASLLRDMRVNGSLLRALIRGLRGRAHVPACAFQGGLQTLTKALTEKLGDRVRTASAVRAIHDSGHRFRVVADGYEMTADRIVLACPAAAAVEALSSLAPMAADLLGGLRYNRFAVVHLRSDLSFDGSGYQVEFNAGLATRGVTCNQALFGRPGLYTAFLGGGTRRGVVDLPDDELARTASAEFEAVTGAEADALYVSRTYMPAWDTSWDALDDLLLPQGISICSNWTGRPGIGSRIAEAYAAAERVAVA